MSKSFNQIFKLEQEAKHFMARLLDNALKHGWSSEEIGKSYRTYREQVEIEKFPRYVSSRLEGMRDVVTVLIERELEFCYTIDGVRYSIRRDSDMYYEKHGITPQVLCEKASLCGHYYISSGRMYYEGEAYKPK